MAWGCRAGPGGVFLVAAGDRGQRVDPAAPLAAGHPPVAEIAQERDDERHGQHDRAQRVQRRAAVAAVLGGVDDHRHRRVAGARRQQVNDHEVVDDPGEHQHGAGEDGRAQQRDHHPAHGRELVGAQVRRGLLVLAAQGDQPGLDDDGRPAHVPGDQPQDLRQGAQVDRGEQHREHEEHRDAEDQLGDHEGQDHHVVERRGGEAAPAVDAERERHAQRDRDDRGEHGQPDGLDDSRVQLGVVQDRVDGIAEVPPPGEALPGALRLAVVEREEHGDADRHQRPDQVQPGEALQEPGVAPRVAAGDQAGQPAAGRGARGLGGPGRGAGRGHAASRVDRFVAIT